MSTEESKNDVDNIKQSLSQPLSKPKKSKTIETQKKIVYGFIRIFSGYVPQDIVNIIYAFVTFRDYISLALIGHVDCGKSTLCGKILEQTGILSQEQLKKNQTEALNLGKGSFKYAFCMDSTNQERSRALTMRGSTKYSFKVGTNTFALIDSPGHRDYLKTTIRYLSMADAAILVVPMENGGFEWSTQKWNHKKGYAEGCTITHARLCYTLGVEQLIVAFNKIDRFRSEIAAHERFIDCKEKMIKILNKIGFKTKRIAFIPIAAFYGENVKEICSNKPYFRWYKGWKIKKRKKEISGFTLFDALQYAVEPNNKFFMNGINQTFKMSVSNYYRISGVGHVVRGRVICGGIRNGQIIKANHVKIYYGGARKLKVESIQMNYQNVNEAVSGDIVSINVSIPKNEYFSNPGKICLSLDKNEKVQYCASFTARVFVQNHPGKIRPAELKKYKQSILNRYRYRKTRQLCIADDEFAYFGGYTATVCVSTWHCPCKLIEIKNNEKGYIKRNDTAEVVFKPMKRMVVFPYDEIKSYGRIVVIDGSIVMIGRVLSVEYVKDDKKMDAVYKKEERIKRGRVKKRKNKKGVKAIHQKKKGKKKLPQLNINDDRLYF